MDKKKLLVPGIIIVVVLATAFGIFLASNQAARQGSTPITTQPNTLGNLSIPEVNQNYTVPKTLGSLSYSTNGNTSFLLFSTSYERLNGCNGKPLVDLQLTSTLHEGDLELKDNQYKYLHPVLQPQGECGGQDGVNLANTAAQMIVTANDQ